MLLNYMTSVALLVI